MNVTGTALPDVLLIEPTVHRDARGAFFESWNAREFERAGIHATFVQDNHSSSVRDVLRGMHYQIRQPQGKLIRVVRGEIFDVVIDIRRSSAAFGRWVGHRLSAENRRMLWAPPGFAHGYLVLSDDAEVLYKTTDYYAPEHERIIRWDDPDIAIRWPIASSPILSGRDSAGSSLGAADVFP